MATVGASECSLAIPAGKVVGLVGPNGAGKTTLLQLSVGLLQPSAGSISVLGAPGKTPRSSARVGFVAQETPTYAGLSIAEHLRFGAWTNPSWDQSLPSSASKGSGSTPARRRPSSQVASAPSLRSPCGGETTGAARARRAGGQP